MLFCFNKIDLLIMQVGNNSTIRNKPQRNHEETMTTNPVVLQILTDELFMPEDEARSQLENNTLDLFDYSENLTDDIVIAILENCSGLMKINLQECGITDAAVIALAERCAGLMKINLQDCNITDAAVIALAEGCPGLTTINLCFCDITDAAVIALAEGCAGLTTINLCCCIFITDSAVIALAEGCAGLRSIDLSICRNITDAAIIALAERCEYLEDISFDETNVSATGRQLIEEIKTRPKPPPLEEGWWMDDGTGPRCKGMMN